MATWGDFIKEVPIVNKRSEGIFVKADHVLDLWEERNKLRLELAQLRQAGGGGASAVELRQAAAAERDACAREIEEMADALGQETDPNPQLITLLHAVARLLREKSMADTAAPMAEPMEEAVADAPMAEPMNQTTGEPNAPMAEASPGIETPTAEFALPPLAEPVEEEESKPAGPTLAELLEREGLPPRQS